MDKIKKEMENARAEYQAKCKRNMDLKLQRIISQHEEELKKQERRIGKINDRFKAMEQNDDFSRGARQAGNNRVAIGIDLGTTFSCVGYWDNEKGDVDIIANNAGNRITPSWVSLYKGDWLVGEDAKKRATKTNTIYDAKRLIGRKFKEEEVQKDIKNWPFNVVRGKKQRAEIEYEIKEGKNKIKKTLAAQEVSAKVLCHMKEVAEDFIGKEVTDAVITVPAYFNNSQRQATKEAGKIADLNVLRIINEPTAAALAFGYNNKPSDKPKNVLIFDLGGGTFDVCIIEIKHRIFKTLAVAGNTHLGGDDFDQILADHLMTTSGITKPKEKKKEKELRQRIRSAAVQMKIRLSQQKSATFEIDTDENGDDEEESDEGTDVTRAQFEEMCADDFKKTIKTCKDALRDAKLLPSQIDDIVLVGGSTRIPKIQEMVKSYFGKAPQKRINPDEAVAHGAAIAAAALAGNIPEYSVPAWYDVTPLTLGIKLRGGRMSPLIDRNTAVPLLEPKSNTYYTTYDNQKTVAICVYEGEADFVKKNHLLGEFNLENIPPHPAGYEIDVSFHLDAEGILHVEAHEKKNAKNAKSIDISPDEFLHTKEEIQQMIDNARGFEAKKKLKEYLREVINGNYSQADKEHCQEVLKTWMKQNTHVGSYAYSMKLKQVQQIVQNRDGGGL